MSDDGSKTDDPSEIQASDVADALAEDDAANARSTDGIEELLDQAQAELAAAGSEIVGSASPEPFAFNELGDTSQTGESNPIDLLNEVDLDLRIELGRTHMRLDDVLQLRSGSVVALDRLAGDPVDIFVNDRLVAKGEVLVLNENFCVRVTELVSGGKS